ncbi:MAG: TRAP transporter small permease [Azospirillaceae bacterium]
MTDTPEDPRRPAAGDTGRPPGLVAGLDRALAGVNWLYLKTGQAILIALAALVFAQVVGRYTLGRSVQGLNELTGFLLVWLVFLMAVVLHRRRRHIVITAAIDLLGPAGRRITGAIVSIGVAAFAVFVCLQMGETMPYLRLRSPVYGIPDWLEKLAPLFAFVPILLQEIVNLATPDGRRREVVTPSI